MEKMRWLRWQIGTVEDTKFRVVARKMRDEQGDGLVSIEDDFTVRDVLALWAVMLEDASRDSNGAVTRCPEWYEEIMGMPWATMHRMMHHMCILHMVDEDGAGGFVVSKIQQYQRPADPTAAERASRYRSRHSNGRHAPTERNGTKITTKVQSGQNAHEGFEEFWAEWPDKRNKKRAEEAWPKAIAKVPLQTIVGGVKTYVASKPADRQWMHAATFLNGERWNDPPIVSPKKADPVTTFRPSGPKRTYAEIKAEKSNSKA